ncbi:MAG: hypothetical protein NXI32_10465 [bacterium]|nr:hypothetical protein [bacterium]
MMCRLPEPSRFVIRREFSGHMRAIRTGRQLRAAVRAGPYCWPGGHQALYLTSDGGCLCHHCVVEHIDEVLASIRHDIHDGWQVSGVHTAAEFPDVQSCACCGTEFEIC